MTGWLLDAFGWRLLVIVRSDRDAAELLIEESRELAERNPRPGSARTGGA